MKNILRLASIILMLVLSLQMVHASAKPLSKREMLKHVPSKLGETKLVSKKYGAILPRSGNKHTLYLRYKDTNKHGVLELYISDVSRDPDLLSEAKMIYGMEAEHGKGSKTPYVSKKNRDGSTQLIYNYANRLIINARSKTYHARKIWKLIRKIPFRRMLK